MANKRELKKKINEICSIMYEQCSAMKILNKDTQFTEIEGIIKGILFLQDKALTVCNKAPRRNARAYFRKELKSLKERAFELYEQLNTL